MGDADERVRQARQVGALIEHDRLGLAAHALNILHVADFTLSRGSRSNNDRETRVGWAAGTPLNDVGTAWKLDKFLALVGQLKVCPVLVGINGCALPVLGRRALNHAVVIDYDVEAGRLG